MKRKKLKSLKSLRAKLDKVFAAFIRKRDETTGGMGSCITCGEYRVLQCGHFQRQRFIPTRWHPLNCAGQCARCNHPLWGGGEQDAFGLAIEQMYGAETVAELRRLAKTTAHFTRSDLEAMIERFSASPPR